MDLKLSRPLSGFQSSGIYGEIENPASGDKLFVTLEHGYSTTALIDPDPKTKPLKFGSIGAVPGYVPKLPPGKYTCVRGMHKLHDGIPFETFMVTGVEDHDGILFHIGNYQRDSEGCILLGKQPMTDGINRSGEAFKEFIELQRTTDSFILEVV